MTDFIVNTTWISLEIVSTVMCLGALAGIIAFVILRIRKDK